MKCENFANLEEVFGTIVKGLVDELDASLARIWLMRPGDICAKCFKASICSYRQRCLHLGASEGINTNLESEYRADSPTQAAAGT